MPGEISLENISLHVIITVIFTRQKVTVAMDT